MAMWFLVWQSHSQLRPEFQRWLASGRTNQLLLHTHPPGPGSLEAQLNHCGGPQVSPGVDGREPAPLGTRRALMSHHLRVGHHIQHGDGHHRLAFLVLLAISQSPTTHRHTGRVTIRLTPASLMARLLSRQVNNNT